jgi:hypothetical protein
MAYFKFGLLLKAFYARTYAHALVDDGWILTVGASLRSRSDPSGTVTFRFAHELRSDTAGIYSNSNSTRVSVFVATYFIRPISKNKASLLILFVCCIIGLN